MLKKIKKDLKKYRKVKYQRVLFKRKDLYLRRNAIKYILKLEKKTMINKEFCKGCKFYLNNLTKKNFLLFYKKFNSKIQLKESYNLINMKKKTNKNACFQSYIIFSKYLKENKKINNIQKLNTILKINDLLIIKFNHNKHLALIKYFKQNIQFEKKLLKLYL
jgi:hypothetical protein